MWAARSSRGRMGHPSGFVIVMIDRSAGGECGGCDGIRVAAAGDPGAGTKGGK